MAQASNNAAPNVDIIVAGEELSDSDFISYVVERDMFQPDMATIVLSNQTDRYGEKFKVADSVTIKVGGGQGGAKEIYFGEVVGVEAIYKGGDTSKIIIRAMNKLHRLLRKRKSVTFTKKTDQDIFKQVVGDAGLELEWKHSESITYEHVYQHNQTDLEFLRTRAARLGCHLWCIDKKVYVKEPDLGVSGGPDLSVDEGGRLRVFTPRLSSAAVVKKVTVKGWNPETKELITGEAQAESSPLGSENAVAASGDFGSEETFTVDHPIWSVQEAKVLAKARLRDLNLTFITGDAECAGTVDYEIGKSVKITANAQGSDRFNGKYYIMGITHRHTLPKAKEGGYVTILKLARDAQKE